MSGAVRAFLVIVGPSLMLDGLLGVSTVAALRGFAHRPVGRRGWLVWLMTWLGAVAPWAYLLRLRSRVLHWGASDAEVHAELPGDEILPEPDWQSTRAIHIAAPVEALWPWLVQMGQNRGGLYSIDWLENLDGLDFRSADRIVPDWQDVSVGDFVRFAPGHDTLVVVRVETHRSLVWLVIRPVDERHCRLIQRFRFGVRPRALALLYPALIEIPHFVMEPQMLRGIRRRAEGAQMTV